MQSQKAAASLCGAMKTSREVRTFAIHLKRPLSFIITTCPDEHLRESNDLAETIQQGFRRFHPGRDRGVQQANFAVLRGSYMPAVLVEIGFGTNADEAAYLNDRNNQRQIAASIARAVLEYLEHYDARIGTGTP